MLNVRMGFCNLLIVLIQFGTIVASDPNYYRTIVCKDGKVLQIRATKRELEREASLSAVQGRLVTLTIRDAAKNESVKKSG